MKKLIKKIFHFFGLNLHRYYADLDNEKIFIKMLKGFNINIVFDIGANTGQYAKLIRQSGYNGKIVSFEPSNDAYKKLSTANSNDPLWEIAPQMAIGNEDGQIKLNVAENSQSSSILEMLEAHSDAAKDSVYVGTNTVAIHKLDSISSSYTAKDDKIFIKIDTQGFEGQVLLGASNLLKNTIGIQMELSLVPLYKNQESYLELLSKMKDLGFELWDVTPVFRNLKSGRLLQIDATFFRQNNK